MINSSEKNNFYNNILRRLQSSFINFLKLSFLERFFITYIGCWSGFLSMFLFSKVLVLLTTKKAVVVAETVASKKFEVVSHAVSSTVNNGAPTYFSVALSYFISNLTACIIILMSFPLVAYIHKKEILKNRSSMDEYLNTMILFYIIIMLNPLTGFLGYNININDIIVILPHGVFEFAGFALSIIMGIMLAEKILPICGNSKDGDNNSDSNNKNDKNINKNKKHGLKEKENIKIILGIICMFVLIGIAASVEPLDWIIYEYAKCNNLSLSNTMVMAYKNVIYYIIHNSIW